MTIAFNVYFRKEKPDTFRDKAVSKETENLLFSSSEESSLFLKVLSLEKNIFFLFLYTHFEGKLKNVKKPIAAVTIITIFLSQKRHICESLFKQKSSGQIILNI